jgi:DNA topoisomerase VI subunit B
MASPFVRKVFTASRLAEFATEAELAKQIGHARRDWLAVTVKELADNALDDAEEHDRPPTLRVLIDTEALTVTVADEGSGLRPETIAKLADFSVKTSSRAAYVSSSRGQQGNALQTLLAMPFVLDPADPGDVVIEAGLLSHRMTLTREPLSGEPRAVVKRGQSMVLKGTKVVMRWPRAARALMKESVNAARRLADAYDWLNPHLAITLTIDGKEMFSVPATDPAWKKWLPSKPTSPHWYNPELLIQWMRAEAAYARDHETRVPTVREFVAQFHALASTAKSKAVVDVIEASRETLADFVTDSEFHVRARAAALLDCMRRTSEPIEPKRLGVIGQWHLFQTMVSCGAVEASLRYKREAFTYEGLPYVIEAAFGHAPESAHLLTVAGLNFSPTVGDQPFGYLYELLEERWIGGDDPVIVCVHMTAPRFTFRDKGKSTIDMAEPVRSRLLGALDAVTAAWAKQQEAETRHASARLKRDEALAKIKPKALTVKGAAEAVMARAYAIVSEDGRYIPNPRQIMYVARPMMLALLPEGTRVGDKYFTQTLFPDYIEAHPRETDEWRVDWDARGHFREPHTGRVYPAGTKETREYLGNVAPPRVIGVQMAKAWVETHGPEGRFAGLQYIEKEGFEAQLQAAQIAERFDLLIVSNKGFSVTATRWLIDELSGRLGLPLYILSDFDISGLGIAKTLTTSNRRYKFKHKIDPARVHHLGLRLADIEGKEREPVAIGINPDAVRRRLERDGATEGERAILMDGRTVRKPIWKRGREEWKMVLESGKRVELNAFTPAEFIAFVERKLIDAGAQKVVPSDALIAETYAAFVRERALREAFERTRAAQGELPVAVPADLVGRVRAALAERPDVPWETLVRRDAGCAY